MAIPNDPEPTMPSTPYTSGRISPVFGNMDAFHIDRLLGGDIESAWANELIIVGDDTAIRLRGYGFTYANDLLSGGTAYDLRVLVGTATGYALQASIAVPNLSVASFTNWVMTGNTDAALNYVLGGADYLQGARNGADLIRGYGGADALHGNGGADSLFGGDGNDVILAGDGTNGPENFASTFLRGEEGNDFIVGNHGFDDAHGNMGNDTVSGGEGNDWSVGGKDQDLLFGDGGDDIVLGNMGDDTCVGGAGDDVVRGGQGNDIVYGSAGKDFVTGDRGDDTLYGGTGADRFHTFFEAGVDRVMDFVIAEGDRVELLPGTTYSVAQVGADVVVSAGGGAQLILVGVQLSALPSGWIFGF